jgi:RimJ/RimL family protein N-acetyltransferase
VPACPTLATERLTLRPLRAEDLDPLFAVISTAEDKASIHLPDGLTRGAAWGILTAFAGLWELSGGGQWALEERSGGRFVGRAGLYWCAETARPGVEAGWMLDPSAWGLGYATEAGARSARYGFEEVGEDTLFSVILPGNVRSEAVARRLGFVPWEELVPHFPAAAHVVWRLERSTWKAGLSAG